jgi:hypothetical protein
VKLVDGPGIGPTLDAMAVLLHGEGEEKAMDVGVAIHLLESATEIVELLGGGPEMVDDKVAIAEASVIGNQQRNRRV